MRPLYDMIYYLDAGVLEDRGESVRAERPQQCHRLMQAFSRLCRAHQGPFSFPFLLLRRLSSLSFILNGDISIDILAMSNQASWVGLLGDARHPASW